MERNKAFNRFLKEGSFQARLCFPSFGATGFYHSDWVVVQTTSEGETNWIVETKGHVWEDTLNKDDAMRYWCKQVSDAAGARWRYMRVDQGPFEAKKPHSFTDLIPLFVKLD